MNRNIILSVLVFLSCNIAGAQERVITGEQLQATAKIVLGPYLQAVDEDSFTVVWMTDMDSAAWVEVAPDDGTHFYACERPKYYETIIGKRPVGKLHKVRVDGLEKGTTYRYRVMQKVLLSEVGQKKLVFGRESGNDPFRWKPYTVTTRNPDAEDFDFAVINDIHGKDSVFRMLMKDVMADSIDAVFFNGDMLSAMDNQNQLLKGYLTSAAELFGANIPFYHGRGNHESRGWFAYRFLDFFPTTTGETYYMVRQGPAAILVLDCGEDKPDSDISYDGLICNDMYREKEARWLEKIVETAAFKEATYKLVLLHIPASDGGWHANYEIQRLFMPILEKAGIDLMISGHIHRYSYSEAGVRAKSFPVLINGASEKHYFHVTKEGMTARRISADGTVLHEYSFPKK